VEKGCVLAVGVWFALVALAQRPARALPAQPQGEQHTAALSKVERLNRAPVNKEPLKVQLPKPVEARLPNGLSVLVIEQHKLPTVAFSLWIKAGALADPKNLPGLASFTADMLREGTTHRTSAQLAAEIDGLGASLSGSAAFGGSYSEVEASGLAPDADKLLELMSDVVLHPTFPQDELDKYKQRALAQLEQERSSPAFLAHQKFAQVIYRDFPAAVVSPTAESIKTVTPNDLRSFHDAYYVPGNAILGVVGDVKPDQALALIRQHFGEWKGAEVRPPALPPLPDPAPAAVYLVDRPNSTQSDLVVGSLALKRTDPDYIPLFVVNRVLGGGPSARLFLNLREVHGYTYGAYSSLSADVYRGTLRASAPVHNAVTDDALHELMAELKRIRDERVSEDELGEAERSIVASFALSLERPAQLLDRAMLVKYYGLPQDYWDRFPAAVARVTPEEVQQVARQYIDLDHLQIVCVGDARQPGNAQGQSIKDVLKKYGDLKVFDTNGKRLE
jgi:zinc protease